MMTRVPLQWLDWPAPDAVKACFSLRTDKAKTKPLAASMPPFDDFNYAVHVGDEPNRVAANRQCLVDTIGEQSIQWLEQVHGTDIVQAGRAQCQADATYTQQKHQVCSVMTADCLPVYFCDVSGSQVAVAHAGWRGLAQGVLRQTLFTFKEPENVMVYLGPAISQQAFEVGDEVREAFVTQLPILASCFVAKSPQKWMADLYQLARLLLNQDGVSQIYGGDYCTYNQSDKFYSYRRDGQTGRMANLIWLV